MQAAQEALERLAAIPNVTVRSREPLSRHTRFGIGGPAEVFVESADREAFLEALRAARATGLPVLVIGGGTNLVAADEGFPGVVLRYTGSRIEADGAKVEAEAGAELQALVDFTIERGLAGLETMTGIPGSVGAAIYGNAGAYGRSISETVREVEFFDGERLRRLPREECGFAYRDSVFKRRKGWVILKAALELEPGETEALRRRAEEIRTVRDRKYPPSMRCAGSIFKNLLVAELPPETAARIPPEVIREGKAPAGYFLEQVGAKGMRRGGISVADYHGNLIYNAGGGTARELRELVEELKRRVRERFGIQLEEEIQYVGF